MTKKEKKAQKFFDILTKGEYKKEIINTLSNIPGLITPDIRKKLQELDMTGLIKCQIDVMVTVFTEKEIDSLIKLSSSPTYKMFQEKGKEYNKKSMEKSFEWAKSAIKSQSALNDQSEEDIN